MRIAVAQFNSVVGDMERNARVISRLIAEAGEGGADLVVVPELAVTGYPPKDLLLKQSFIRTNLRMLERISAAASVPTIVGCVRPHDAPRGRGIFNTAALCSNGDVSFVHDKCLLPTYDVFDELRYFDAGQGARPRAVEIGGRTVRIGVTICEDLWDEDLFFSRQLHAGDPAAELVADGAELIVNIGASPFSVGKPQRRVELFGAKARRHGVPIVYADQVGGNDDLVFDGASGAFDADGDLIAQAKSFEEDLLFVNLESEANRIESLPDGVPAIHDALVLGTRDYVAKCGFEGVVLGASGGIDSSVVSAVAVEALGAERVELVAMPSRYSSSSSLEDAEELAATLGTRLTTIPIEEVHAATERVLRERFAGRDPDVTEENIQARARGTILMALSNKFQRLLLTTGNKSELAVGYCTLYGDMCGGLAVLSDVPKTIVYELARHFNLRAGRAVIPERVLAKAPSAELKADQTDQDSLPPYDVLDEILERYVEGEQSADEIAAAGFDRGMVDDVVGMVDRNEYKRRQAPVGLRVTKRAFGPGRRMPIAAKYR